MENAKSQLIESIRGANNVLVTVSSNPSVDQLSAAIGLTLLLNKMGKHATAVYSGSTPSTIEFLHPEKTLEKTTDSLRDFIIALDKSKADKLRYKVEENHVKIFITPYRTSITDKDLEFSQGDFNVDVVVALGVIDQKDLDQVITAHGRILHDAATISVTTGERSSLGSINWAYPEASSLCEMVSSIADDLQANILDGQMATALMTGIVAETHRFSNEKTTPGAMSASAKLMAAGANQQLVASKLQETAPSTPEAAPTSPEAQASDGSLQITHAPSDAAAVPEELPALQDAAEPAPGEIAIDEHGNVTSPDNTAPEAAQPPEETEKKSAVEGGSSLILEPPTLGGKLTASAEPEHLDPAVDPLAGGSHDKPLLSHQPAAKEEQAEEPLPELNGTEDLPGPTMTLPSEADKLSIPPESVENAPVPETLTDIEAAVASPHLEQAAEQKTDASLPGSDELSKITEQFAANPEPTPSLDNARDAVSAAMAGGDTGPLPPLEAIASQPLDLDVNQTGQTGVLDHIDEETGIPEFRAPDAPETSVLPAQPTGESPQVTDPNAPPPVPPPMMPFDPNGVVPPMPGQDQPAPQGNPQNPFNLPPT